MECQSAEVIICFISAIAAIAAVVVAHKSSKRQMQISLFAEFTRRYQEIMLHIRKKDGDEKHYKTLYIDLCSEEFFMNNEGYLPKEVWEIWKEGMEHEVKGDYYELWQEHKEDYNPKFQEFFNEIVVNNAKKEDNLK